MSRLDVRYGLVDARILDLFAGTGALGIEALSRSAGSVVAVEHDFRVAKVLRGNVEALGLGGKVRILERDYGEALATLERELGRGNAAAGNAASDGRFDGVFLDPPYRQGLAEAALASLAASGLLVHGAWIAVETGFDEDLPQDSGDARRVREDRYGSTKVTLYENDQLEDIQ